MNMIALVNQVMAAIVALLVMVRLLQVLMIATAAIGAALSWITAGASLAVVAPATEVAADAEEVYDELKNVVTPILRALHVFELGLKYGMPIAAGRIPPRLAPVFRDRDELPTASDLGAVIEDALRQSWCLIVICSPDAAKRSVRP